jgi:hypothetical protein
VFFWTLPISLFYSTSLVHLFSLSSCSFVLSDESKQTNCPLLIIEGGDVHFVDVVLQKNEDNSLLVHISICPFIFTSETKDTSSQSLSIDSLSLPSSYLFSFTFTHPPTPLRSLLPTSAKSLEQVVLLSSIVLFKITLIFKWKEIEWRIVRVD